MNDDRAQIAAVAVILIAVGLAAMLRAAFRIGLIMGAETREGRPDDAGRPLYVVVRLRPDAPDANPP